MSDNQLSGGETRSDNPNAKSTTNRTKQNAHQSLYKLQYSNQHYIVYGMDCSYFTQKLVFALHYTGLRYSCSKKSIQSNQKQIEMRAGTHMVPILHTPDQWIIHDTTPLLHLISSRLSATTPKLYPMGIVGVVSAVMEEYFDEYWTRIGVHMRWNYPDCANVVCNRLGIDTVDTNDISDNVVRQAAERIKYWGQYRAVVSLGIDNSNPNAQLQMECEIWDVLSQLDKHIESHPYILGRYATSVDCIVLGSLHAHFLRDPEPLNRFRVLPTLYKWYVANCNLLPSVKQPNRIVESYQWINQTTSIDMTDYVIDTPFVHYLLHVMSGCYRDMIRSNMIAVQHKQKTFTTQLTAKHSLQHRGQSVQYRISAEQQKQIHDVETTFYSRPLTVHSHDQLQHFIHTHIHNIDEIDQYNQLMQKSELYDLYGYQNQSTSKL